MYVLCTADVHSSVYLKIELMDNWISGKAPIQLSIDIRHAKAWTPTNH